MKASGIPLLPFILWKGIIYTNLSTSYLHLFGFLSLGKQKSCHTDVIGVLWSTSLVTSTGHVFSTCIFDPRMHLSALAGRTKAWVWHLRSSPGPSAKWHSWVSREAAWKTCTHHLKEVFHPGKRGSAHLYGIDPSILDGIWLWAGGGGQSHLKHLKWAGLQTGSFGKGGMQGEVLNLAWLFFHYSNINFEYELRYLLFVWYMHVFVCMQVRVCVCVCSCMGRPKVDLPPLLSPYFLRQSLLLNLKFIVSSRETDWWAPVILLSLLLSMLGL